jgi:NADH:ubiquinone oxidoreductase subunit 6 (subunit J)
MFLDLLFIISAALTILGTLLVVFSKNLLHACVYLLASFIGVAGLYVTLGADFIAAIQLVVYAGGVVILMLFAIMLTGGNSTPEKLKSFALGLAPEMGNSKTYTLAFLSAGVLSSIIGYLIFSMSRNISEKSLQPFVSTVEILGKKLITEHVLVFEISSVLLLGALVGAAIIARPNKSNL